MSLSLAQRVKVAGGVEDLQKKTDGRLKTKN